MDKFIFLVFCIFSFSVQASTSCQSVFKKSNPVYQYIFNYELKGFKGGRSLDPSVDFKKMTSEHFIDFFVSIKKGIEREFKKIKNDEYKTLADIHGIYRLYDSIESGKNLFDFLLNNSDVFYTKKSINQIKSILKNIYYFPNGEEVSEKLNLIFKRSNKTEKGKLSNSDRYYIEDMINNFVAHSYPELKQIFKKLHTVSNAINEVHNNMKKNNFYIKDRNLLKGLSEEFIEEAGKEAYKKGREGAYYINVTGKGDFLSYVHDRDLRKKFYERYYKDSPIKRRNIRNLLHVKEEIAKFYDFKSYTDYYWSDKPLAVRGVEEGAADPIIDFLIQTIDELKVLAQKDIDELESKAKDLHGIRKIEFWDLQYYYNWFKRKEEPKTKIFIPSVLDEMFKHFEKLLNVKFEENNTFLGYKDGLQVYNVYHRQRHKGILILDLFATTNTTSSESGLDGLQESIGPYSNSKFFITTIQTFFKLNNDYISLKDIVSLFHEMGHVMQVYLSPQISEVKQSLDQIEFFSLLQEKFSLTDTILQSFSKNDSQVLSRKSYFSEYGSTPLSVELLDSAYKALLNISLHSTNEVKDLKKFERDFIKTLNLSPFLKNMLLSQNVIVSGIPFRYEGSLDEGGMDLDSISAHLDSYSYIYSNALAAYFLNQYLSKTGDIYNYKLRRRLISLYGQKTFSLKDIKSSKEGTISNKQLVRAFLDYHFY